MARTVFILGAGASREAGAPLMGEFLDVAHQVRHSGRLDAATAEHFDRVHSTIGRLQPVHSKCAALDLVNVESVFATLEVAKLLRKLPGLQPSQIDDAIESLKILIVRTLELTVGFPVGRDGASSSATYSKFVQLVRHLRDGATPRQSVAVITFNYDVAVDAGLVKFGISPDYALDDGAAAGANSIPLLKLHGSLNWAACEVGKHVVAWEILKAAASVRQLPIADNLVGILVGSDIHNFQHCGQAVSGGPVIVPPTWNKGTYHEVLGAVWARAAQELADAENIFVIGYSLPPSDHFFPLLFGLGTVGEAPLRRFWVLDPDPAVSRKFEQLLGPGALQRFRGFDKDDYGNKLNFGAAAALVAREFKLDQDEFRHSGIQRDR